LRVITIKCPECGAAVNAQPDAETAQCEYCGTTAQIRHRSPILQIPRPLPAAKPGQTPLPVATQASAIGKIGCSFMLFGILAGVAVPIALAVKQCDEQEKQQSTLREPRWDGADRAVAVDITGDGVDDIIGRVRVIQPQDILMVGAFDGRSGKRLWISETIGERSDVLSGPLAVADEVVVVGDGSAGLFGLSLRDGGTKWKIRLNEVVERICAGDEAGTVKALTADKKLHPVAVADGALRPAGELSACIPLPNGDPRSDQPYRITYAWSNDYRAEVPDDSIEGMAASTALHHVQGDVTVALGYKKPGTRVPMLASYRWPADTPAEASRDPPPLMREARNAKTPERRRALLKEYAAARKRSRRRRDRKPEVLWTAQVPGIDPLQVKSYHPEPEKADLNDQTIVIAYETRETHHFRMAAFSIADGKRKWDIELPGDRPLASVAVSRTHAMVSRWDGLHVYDIETGARAFAIE
jgi:DNA-directed RNA polymerase subunit RPC12/RpoP